MNHTWAIKDDVYFIYCLLELMVCISEIQGKGSWQDKKSEILFDFPKQTKVRHYNHQTSSHARTFGILELSYLKLKAPKADHKFASAKFKKMFHPSFYTWEFKSEKEMYRDPDDVVHYRIFSAIRWGFRRSRLTTYNSHLKLCYYTSLILPEQSRRSRAIL